MPEGVKRIYRKLMIIMRRTSYDTAAFLDTFLGPMIVRQPVGGVWFGQYAERIFRTTVAETISPRNVTLCRVLSKSVGRKCASINTKSSFAE